MYEKPNPQSANPSTAPSPDVGLGTHSDEEASLGAHQGRSVDEEGIQILVHTFYARVREDPELGPIFERQISGDWQPHLSRMVDFWSSVLLGTGRFRGNPMLKHATLPDLEPRHFDRWLEIFEPVVGSLFEPESAQLIRGRARAMRGALESFRLRYQKRGGTLGLDARA